MASASKKRRSYPPAYRRDAADLVIDTGRPIATVAREIGSGSSFWAVGLRSNGLDWAIRRRRWIRTNAPNWSGCGSRSTSCAWIGNS